MGTSPAATLPLTGTNASVRVLAISGSIRAGSSSAAVLDAARLVAPHAVEIVRYGGLARLPAFDPDVEDPAMRLPREVRRLRAGVASADAMIISSPEYAHGIPGALKNLLDWLVGSVHFVGMPVALVAPSERPVFAHAQLAEVLRTMSARLVPEESVMLPITNRSMDAASIAADRQLGALLRITIAALCHSVDGRAMPRRSVAGCGDRQQGAFEA